MYGSCAYSISNLDDDGIAKIALNKSLKGECCLHLSEINITVEKVKGHMKESKGQQQASILTNVRNHVLGTRARVRKHPRLLPFFPNVQPN